MEAYKMGDVYDFVDESRHSSWADFKSNSEIYKNTKFEDIESVFNTTHKSVREHSEKILNVKFLENSSPSWARSALANDVSGLIPFNVLDK